MFVTIEAVASDVISLFTPEDKELYKTYSDIELLKLHSSFGRFIRNEYGLWKADNPLTRPWHERSYYDGVKHIVNGIDEHPNHPDAISSRVLHEIRRQLQMMN